MNKNMEAVFVHHNKIKKLFFSVIHLKDVFCPSCLFLFLMWLLQRNNWTSRRPFVLNLTEIETCTFRKQIDVRISVWHQPRSNLRWTVLNDLLLESEAVQMLRVFLSLKVTSRFMIRELQRSLKGSWASLRSWFKNGNDTNLNDIFHKTELKGEWTWTIMLLLMFTICVLFAWWRMCLDPFLN